MRTSILLRTTLVALTTILATSTLADHDKDEHTITQTYNFDGFDHVNIGGVYEVDISVGSKHSISLRGIKDEMDNVKIKTEDQTLYLGRKNKHDTKSKNNHNHGIKAKITLPNLKGLRVSGVATGNIEGVSTKDFNLAVSGVAKVDINGTCENLTARISGVGGLDARDLKCEDVDIKLSGVGEVFVFASEAVDVTASGVGGVNVYGKPTKVNKKNATFTQVRMK